MKYTVNIYMAGDDVGDHFHQTGCDYPIQVYGFVVVKRGTMEWRFNKSLVREMNVSRE